MTDTGEAEMEKIEQEVDRLFVNYFSDFSNLDLKAIASYFHYPCTFIVPQGVFIYSSVSEVEGFWGPRFDDLRTQKIWPYRESRGKYQGAKREHGHGQLQGD